MDTARSVTPLRLSALAWQRLAALMPLVLMACLVYAPFAARAQAPLPVPALTARVMDQTGTLDDGQRQALEHRLAAIESARGTQIVVLMLPSTAPEDIAAYAHRVADTWKIGRREVGDGLLIVVAKDDRAMRIEVARALEGAIPDVAAARIIDGAMAPRFRQSDFAGGLDAALTHIEARLAGEALPLPGDGERRQARDETTLEGLAAFLFFGVMLIGPGVRRLFGNRLGSALMGAGAGTVAYVLTASLGMALAAGLIALFYTWLFSNTRGGPIWHGGSGGTRGGGWSGGGGFRSGGGGSFGGGGASGRW